MEEIQLINHHIHSTGSDGKSTPKDIVEEAISKGLSFICFTDHYPRASGEEWTKDFFSQGYVNEILKLKKEYASQIEICLGVELDWFEEHQEAVKKQAQDYPFDYVLGSVHFIKDKDGIGIKTTFDKDAFEKAVKKNGGEALTKEYYKQLRLLIKSKIFDSIAHFDAIKTLSKNNKSINITNEMYKQEVLKTLDLVKKNNLCIEINTCGFIYACKEQFPSLWILKEANKRQIPITIGSDHHAKTYDKSHVIPVDYKLKQAYNLAKQSGYNSVVKFKNRQRINVPI